MRSACLRDVSLWCISFLYLVAIMGWINRKVLDETLATHGVHKLFNTDQGTQSASAEWSGRLVDADSMHVVISTLSNTSTPRRKESDAGLRTISEWPHRASLSACTGSARASKPLALEFDL